MNTLELSSKEIIYVASLCDADVFYGIPDGFYGMENAEIAVEINKIKVDLTNKGYAEMNFDGDFIVSPEVMGIISDCVFCDKYITFDKSCLHTKQFIRFYLKENNSYMLTENEGYYLIERMLPYSVKDKLIGFIDWIDSTAKLESGVVIEKSLLYKLKSMSEFDNPEKELCQIGCNATNANVIYRGLSGGNTYYSLSVIDNTKTYGEINSLIFVNSSVGTLQLNSHTKDDEECIDFEPILYEQIIESICTMLQNIGYETEAKFS